LNKSYEEFISYLADAPNGLLSATFCGTKEKQDEKESSVASVTHSTGQRPFHHDMVFAGPKLKEDGPNGLSSATVCLAEEKQEKKNSAAGDMVYAGPKPNEDGPNGLSSATFCGTKEKQDEKESSVAGVTHSTGKCPFLHGTVYAGPYPGYIHGNPKRGICPNGCRAELNREITKSETPKETLLREAMEYLELYYSERTDEMKGTASFVSKEERMAIVKKSIHEAGTYEHTFDELEHGARVAWRNAPKCSNRKYWQ
jgi:hypothetical protein